MATLSPPSSPFAMLSTYLGDVSRNARDFDYSRVIDKILQNGNVPSEHLAVLEFTKSLLQFGNNDMKTGGWLLGQMQGPSLSESLASLLFPRKTLEKRFQANGIPTDVNPDAIEKIRINFFQAEPLVTMKVLVDKPRQFSLSADVKVLASHILHATVNKGLELNSSVIVKIVEQSVSSKGNGLPSDYQTNFEIALGFVKVLRSLCRLVQNPEDVPRLYKQGYHIIRDIATERETRFTNKMVRAGMTRVNALATHHAAQRVDCWNTHFWLTMMEARRTDFIPLVPEEKKKRPSKKVDSGEGDKTLRSNNLTDIFKLEDAACETCCSITSLTAYFADLMGQLKTTRSNKTQETLLEILAKRRPDLQKLQLTCANAQTIIPYISLVNEVLESFIRYNYEKARDTSGKFIRDSVQAYDTPEDAQTPEQDVHSDTVVYQPGNTDNFVYSSIISGQMYPFTCFPYNRARDEVSQILDSFKVQMPELVKAFTVRQRFLRGFPGNVLQCDVKDRLERCINEILARQSAAEVLGLQQAEFAAITGQTFFPRWYTDLFNGLTDRTQVSRIPSANPWKAADLWGYGTTDAMVSQESSTCLSLIKSEFMKRANLEFEDILELARTQCFGQDLVIVNKDGTKEFQNSLEGLLLLSSSSEPPYKQLTEKICFNLQAFLRLRAKLSWTTKDLDAAILCLRSREMETASIMYKPRASDFFSISPYVLKGIASIVKLAEITDQDPASLLPLWGAMDTYGENSFMHRKFLTPALRQVSPIFDLPREDRFLILHGSSPLLTDASGPISTSLGWPVEHYPKLLEAANLKNSGTELTVETFSTLYRYVLITKILEIPPKECDRFFKLFFAQSGDNPLDNPTATLSAIEKWKKLLDGGWTVESLYDVLDPSNSTVDEELSIGDGLRIISSISQGAKEMRNSCPFLFTNAPPNSKNIAECAARTFDAATAKVVVAFVEGTQFKSTKIVFGNLDELNEAIGISERWPQKLRLTPDVGKGAAQAELSITGALTAEESQAIEHLSVEPESLKQAINNLLKQALAVGDIIRSRFQKAQGSNTTCSIEVPLGTKSSAKTSTAQEGTGNAGVQEFRGEFAVDEEKELIRTELLRQERRSAFVQLAAPTIIQELSETLIVNTIQGVVPDLDSTIIPVLLSHIIRLPSQSGDGHDSVMTALQRLSEPSDGTATASLDAYFTPNTTDVFTLSYLKEGKEHVDKLPNLTVNGVKISFNNGTVTWNPFQMMSGQTYHLQGNFHPSQLLWSTPKSMTSGFTDEMLLPAAKALAANKIMTAVRRVASICKTLKITAEELEYFGIAKAEVKRILAIDFSAPTLDILGILRDYREFKERCHPTSSSNSLISLFLWLSRTTAVNRDAIVAQIAACTGWNKGRLLEALDAKYPSTDDGEANLMANLQKFDELLSLQAIIRLDERLGLAAGVESQPSMWTLFDIAHSRHSLSFDDDLTVAQSLRTRLTLAQRAAADQGLMENQRKALVAYLLQQDYIKKLKISDADGLFEHFLIDVQMGPQLRTSRIKQAISVVQLFAQRCLLGLEEEVSKNSLIREQWEWRQQYTLWEAHLKLFLYPENWLEPSLRDDKSQLFEEFEASLMKKNLSLDTFTQAIKTYVYGLNEISSLEVVAYIHEPQGIADIFHLFGRTRASPHTFYHRTLTVMRPAMAVVFWRPWTKIEIDIPSLETEWEGKRLDTTGSHLIPVLIGGRLYLFIPQISPKSERNESEEATAYESNNFASLAQTNANTAKPKRTWEITMAWTELSRGTWTPKRVSAGSVTLETVVQKPNELRFEPKFDADRTSNKLIIIAGYPYEDQGRWSYRKFGGFSFCEDQTISLSKKEFDTFELTAQLFKPSFQQRTVEGLTSPEAIDASPDKITTKRPFLWIPQTLLDFDKDAKAGRKTKSVSWTLSYGREEAPTGLVMSVQRSDGKSISYFSVPKGPLYPLRNWEVDSIKTKMETVILDHTFSHELMKATAIRADPLSSVFDVLTTRKPHQLSATFGAYSCLPPIKLPHTTPIPPIPPTSPIPNTPWDILEEEEETEDEEKTLDKKRVAGYHELARPTSLYNWEIGLHSVLMAVDRFFATQQFEEALEVARLVFDPTVDVQLQRYVGSSTDIEKIESCWKFPPFQDIARRVGKKRGVNLKLSDVANNSNFNLSIMERRSHGALVHATARGRPEAYMKWIVMKYAEILIAAGDVHFRRGTLESLPLAIQRYTQASHILGPVPPKVPKLGKRKPLNFDDLADEDVKLDLELPFSPQLVETPKENRLSSDPKGEKIVSHLLTTYFCVPLNPKFKQMRSLVDERLFNIRNSLDIQGKPIKYALREPSIDPGALVALSGSQGLSASVLGDQDSPMPRQRFEVLLQRALELCNELRGLGERLLSAVEKKEGEAFSAMRARHATAIQKMMLDIKKTHLTEAQQTINALMLNRESQASQLSFYLALIGEPESLVPSAKDPWVDIRQDIDTPSRDDLRMSSYEKMEMDMMNTAGVLNLVASGIDGLVAPLCLIPNIEANTAPMGVGATLGVGGSSIALAVSAGSTYIKMLAMIAREEAGRASRKAQLTRQLQERRLQANIRGREIKSIDKQIDLQNIRIKAAQQEIDMQESDIEEAIQVETWYRTKYSSEQLYSWMEKSLRGLYYQAYTLAIGAARRAEAALSFENGHRTSLLRPAGYWDASRDGLLSADHLYLDLKRLETAYADSIKSDYDITKTVSLRQINPLALLTLRIKGSTTFSLSENLFDTDFPGHYMRRIRSVSVSVPAVVGPHSNINATLRLMGHRYRVSSTVAKAADYAAQDRDSFRTDHIPISAVAISSGSYDSGVFELAFSGHRYVPFEGAGAISTWQLDLPEIRKFDYETISDVVLHVQYTALDGGAYLRSMANETVRNASKAITNEGRDEGFWAMLDLKNDFDGWYGFSSRLIAGKKSGATASIQLGNLKNRLPFWSRQQKKLKVRSITWVSRSSSLINTLNLKGVVEPTNPADSRTYPLGESAVKTWKNLEVANMNGWELTATGSALEKEDTVPNVYMLMRYTYG